MTVVHARSSETPGTPPDPDRRSGAGRPVWFRPATVEALIALVDVLLVTAAGVSCAVLYHIYFFSNFGKPDIYTAASALVAINFWLLTKLQHGYNLKSMSHTKRQLRVTSTIWTGVFAGLLAFAFTLKVSEDFSRGAMISFYIIGLLTMLAWKAVTSFWIQRALREGAFANSRAVVIAELGLATTSSVLDELRDHGYRFMRIFELAPVGRGAAQLTPPDYFLLEEMISYAKSTNVEEVFLLIDWSHQQAIDRILDALKILPIPVHLVPDTNVSRFLKSPEIRVGSAWTAELRRAPLSRNERSVKRVLDVTGAVTGLLICAPIMMAAALLIKLTSKGPIIFRQTRNGFNGTAFLIFKFRTMRVQEDGPIVIQATQNDPRVTMVGKWLRKTSIDELPQLLNVLLGDMSLVGPRPHAAAHNSEYQLIIGNYAFRHHVRPGITGWAQVNGYRGETRALELMKKRVELDLWYIDNWSIWLDVRILLSTVLISFRSRGVY